MHTDTQDAREKAHVLATAGGASVLRKATFARTRTSASTGKVSLYHAFAAQVVCEGAALRLEDMEMNTTNCRPKASDTHPPLHGQAREHDGLG